MNNRKKYGYHQLGAAEYAEITARDVVERFKEATGTKTLSALANWLEEDRAHLAHATQRNSIPVAWFRLLILKKSTYNPVWVLTGQGEKIWSLFLHK